jgi:hypothetical protein
MIDKLAKLLATENIVVEHRNAHTASFDTKDRILTLPMWKDVTAALETLLVGHEVGHALYTPYSGWNGMETEKKTICNIVEDARIERKMKIKYPGLRRDFYEGYKELFHKDFFKIKDQKIEKMNFLNRINLYFKIGSFTPILFQEDEKPFIDEIEEAKTWDEVVCITDKIFDFLKDKEDNIQSPLNDRRVDGGGREDDDELDQEDDDELDQEDTELDQGDGWILQTCSTGWWLVIYPFTFIEYSKGCVAVNYITPHDIKNEFGFDLHTQYYFSTEITQERRDEFEFYVEPVFKEDVVAIEKQRGPWFPITVPYNRLEKHCVHYGKWVMENKAHR